MIRMSQFAGPWPKCLGMTGQDCVNYIDSYAQDLEGRIYIISPGTAVTEDFQTDRVRIYVDEDGIVTAIPDRG
jgi:hypothetical protein